MANAHHTLFGPMFEPRSIYDCTMTVSMMKVEQWTMTQQEKEEFFIFDPYLFNHETSFESHEPFFEDKLS